MSMTELQTRAMDRSFSVQVYRRQSVRGVMQTNSYVRARKCADEMANEDGVDAARVFDDRGVCRYQTGRYL